MSEQTLKCPVCGEPDMFYMYHALDQSACPSAGPRPGAARCGTGSRAEWRACGELRPAAPVKDGGWHYTSMNDGRIHPIGYCWEHPAHPSEDEARRCYRDYQLDSNCNSTARSATGIRASARAAKS